MSLQAAFDQARQWLESSDLERAIGLSEHILASHPQNLEAYRILGEACLANRQLDRAQESFERVLRSDPENIPAHVGLGITFERRGRLERAVQEFEQALEIRPDMPELRSQLLRLYSEGGIENPQLRLSRPGLARLYAKGHMLPQAITEFRQVIADQPDRYDAKVALAETLWRNEQEVEAATLCRQLLNERPELLKARLLLGYIDLAEGRPEGEAHWREAARMDPYQTVARAMFDPLPPIAVEPAEIEEWDEQAWRRRRADEQEQLAATRPMEAMQPPAVAEEVEEVEEAFVPGTSFFDRRAAPAFDMSSSDDFLAGLLALEPGPAPEEPQPQAAAPEAADLDLDVSMKPFSLADLGLSDDEIAGLESLETVDAQTPTGTAAPTPPAPAADETDEADLGDMQPFSLLDLDEPAARPAEPAPAAPQEQEDEADLGDMQPFSLLDLDEPAARPAEPAPAAPEADDEVDLSGMQPFSLADLGLSEDEIAGLDSLRNTPSSAEQWGEPARTQPAPGSSEPEGEVDLGDLPVDLQPFTFDELDMGGGGERDDVSGLPPSLQPFSLDEAPPQPRPRVSGLTPEPEAGLEPDAEDDDEPLPSQRGFSWQQPTQKPEPGFVSSMRTEAPEEGSIFGKLKQRRQSEPPPEPDPLPPVTLDEKEDLGLFSLDDVPLRDESSRSTPPPMISGIARREGTATSPESQPAPARQEPPEEIENLQEALATGQVQPFSLADLGLSEEEMALLQTSEEAQPAPQETEAAPPAGEIEDLQEALATGQVQPFSLADLGLSEEEMALLETGEEAQPTSPATEEPTQAAPQAEEPAEPEEIEDLQGAIATGQVQPFSLADLGLSDDEIAALGFGEQPQATEPAEPATPEEPAAPQAEQPAEPEEIEDLQDAIATGQVQPFSLADLGLSDDEIAALGIGEEGAPETQEAPQEPASPATEEPAQATPQAEEPAEPEEIEDLQDAIATGQVQPFSLADLGLSDDEIAALGLGAAEPEAGAQTQESEPQAAAPAEDPSLEPGLQPFSLADLGISDEDLGSLDLGVDERLGLTEEELAGLDLGGDVDLTASETQPPPAGQPVITGDLIADRLLALGREQGFVDISDIIAAVEDPEAEAARIEQIGQLLHQNNIEIRDGDEVIDMDAEYADEEEAYEEQAAPAAEDEPTLTPFSLSELGLTEEEIEGLGIAEPDEPAQAAPPAPGEEPDLTPFSLSELDEEPAAQEAAPPARDEEPDLTPFSLSELGLTPEEIALLGLAETPAPQEPAPQEEAPDLTPFSLAELGMAEEEPPAQEQPAPAEAVAPPPTPAPPTAPAQPATPSPSPAASTGNATLDGYLARLEQDPGNHTLRLSLARISAQLSRPEVAIRQYRQLIKQNALLDDLVDDLLEMIDESDDNHLLRQLHRTLGDAYARMGRLEESIEVNSWTPGRPKASA